MKIKNLLMGLTASTLLVPAAFAQVEFNLTGSSAFRNAIRDRITNSVLDVTAPWGYKDYTDASGNVYRTFWGMYNQVTTKLTNTPAIIRDSFSGSAEGVRDVKNQYYITYGTTNGTVTNMTSDCAFSDVAPIAARVSAKGTDFANDTKVGVVPFMWIRSASADMAGVTNITRDQALSLFASDGLMNSAFLGGGGVNPVYLVGRNDLSGTRITAEKCTGNTGALFQYDTTTLPPVGGFAGYTSGGLVKNAFYTNASTYNLVSYISVNDGRTLTNTWAIGLSYNGVTYTTNAVQTGSYSFWSYEHMLSKSSISGNQLNVYNALKAAITDTNFQNSSSVFQINYIPLNTMKVVRDGDGTPPY